jgi:hypothetical protein
MEGPRPKRATKIDIEHRTTRPHATARTLALQDTQNLVSGEEPHLGDTVRVPESDTDLRGRQALASEFDDLLNDLLGSGLEPDRGCAAVRESGGR